MIQSGHVISLYHWSAPAIFSLSCTLPIWWCTAAHCCGKESIYSDLNVCLLAPRKSSLFAFLPAGDSHVVSIHFANVVDIFDSFPIGCCVQWFCTFGACCESPGMNLEPHFSWADAVQAEILRAQVCVWWGKAEHSGHRTFCLTRHQGEIFHQEMPLRLIYCIDSRMMGLPFYFLDARWWELTWGEPGSCSTSLGGICLQCARAFRYLRIITKPYKTCAFTSILWVT